MKKQLTTIAILVLILTSCSKDTAPELPDNVKDLKTENKPVLAKGGGPKYITLQAVVVGHRFEITFGWEYDEDGNDYGGHLLAFSINGSMAPGGGHGGFNHTWTQTQSFWSNTANNPNVIKFMIEGQDTFTSTSAFGAIKVVKTIIIKGSYDVASGVYVINGISTGGTIKN